MTCQTAERVENNHILENIEKGVKHVIPITHAIKTEKILFSVFRSETFIIFVKLAQLQISTFSFGIILYCNF